MNKYIVYGVLFILIIPIITIAAKSFDPQNIAYNFYYGSGDLTSKNIKLQKIARETNVKIGLETQGQDKQRDSVFENIYNMAISDKDINRAKTGVYELEFDWKYGMKYCPYSDSGTILDMCKKQYKIKLYGNTKYFLGNDKFKETTKYVYNLCEINRDIEGCDELKIKAKKEVKNCDKSTKECKSARLVSFY